jgi:hypothetical protein
MMGNKMKELGEWIVGLAMMIGIIAFGLFFIGLTPDCDGHWDRSDPTGPRCIVHEFPPSLFPKKGVW